MDELVSMLRETGLPFAYHHYAEGESPAPPFLCYLITSSHNFAADGAVFYRLGEIHVELYTDRKDPSCEGRVEAVLDEHGLFYNKTETWIKSEKLYEVLYQFELEV